MAETKTVKCYLCPRGCQLREGERGNCRARMNIGGKLTSLVYGKPCAVHVDPIEKKPIFHMYPKSASFSIATAGCNLHCRFCQNWQISQVEPEKTKNYDLPPEEVVRYALEHKCKTIAYTYTEPVVCYEYMFDTCRIAHQKGIKNIVVTAGYIETEPLLELCPLIDGANVDLKGITEKYYRDVCFGTLAPVQRCIKIMRQKGVWVEITNLIVPTLNDKEEDIAKLIDWVLDNVGPEVPLHFSRFWPQYQLKNLPPTPEKTLDMAWQMARAKGVHYTYVGNVPGHEGNNTYCPKDGKLLVRRVGYSVLEYNIVDGKCKFCGHKIPGRWEL
ncbi:MAG: AmmeMemoRadiSam system radical SAM enzyme [Candidatus Omnitrophota bacterium]